VDLTPFIPDKRNTIFLLISGIYAHKRVKLEANSRSSATNSEIPLFEEA
jgi:hypothetical protein